VAQVPVDHVVGPVRQRAQRGVVAGGAHADHFAVGAVGAAAQRHPGQERLVQFVQGGERPSGQDMVTHDPYLAFDAALAGGPVGGQHIDG
jgi:hypothetical protein